MGGHAIIAILLALCACATTKPKPSEPSDDGRALYQATAHRLAVEHVQSGYVVTRTMDGSPEHLGEGLLWAGTFLWAAPCDEGAAVSAALAAGITAREGQLVRIEPLGEYGGGREVTLDGALGLYAGIARRVVDCGEADLWRLPFELHINYLDENGAKLNAKAPAYLVGEFTLLPELIGWRLGLMAEPSRSRMGALERQVAAWAAAVNAAHAACYRINLGMTSLLATEASGWQSTETGRSAFCAATRGTDIPTVEHWCGRENLSGYLARYDPWLWEYRHQRCGAWEMPDGDGNTSHQLDRLVALVMLHGWRTLQGG